MSIEQDIERSARIASYGVHETGPLWMSGISHDQVRHDLGKFSLADKRVVKIERLRLLTDRGFPWWDISYCYGRLATGELVNVDLGTYQIEKAGRGSVSKAHLIRIAKNAGRWAKGVGLLEQDGNLGQAISELR